MAGNFFEGAAIRLVTLRDDEDLADAERVIQGVDSYHDVFHERITNRVMKDIKPGDFPARLKEVAGWHKFPDTVEERILSGGEYIYEFYYCRPSYCDVKNFAFVRIALEEKADNCIDLAYSVNKLRFLPAAKIFDQEHTRPFLDFVTTGTAEATWTSPVEWQQEHEAIKYFRHKVIEGFSKRYFYLLTGFETV